MQSADVFEWLEYSDLAVYIRQSPLLFPAIEIVHIIGFIFLVGSAFLFDLRLLGVARNISVQRCSRLCSSLVAKKFASRCAVWSFTLYLSG